MNLSNTPDDFTKNSLISFSNEFSVLFGIDIQQPNKALSLCQNSETFQDELAYSFYEDAIWGSDCRGGFSYFGKTEDIESIFNLLQTYLQNTSLSSYEYLKGLLFWNLGTYSLINLYDDYYPLDSNPLPIHEKCLLIQFGALSDDYTLPNILQTVLNGIEHDACSDINSWITFGKKPFNVNDSEQKSLMQLMINSIHKIDSNIDL